MATGVDRPQEDEFALVAMGVPTPYCRMAFPNDPPVYDEFLDMDGCAPTTWPAGAPTCSASSNHSR